MRLRSVFGWSLRIRAAPLGPWKHADDDKPSYAANQSIDQSVEPARITWQVQRHHQNGGDGRLNGNHGSAIQQDGDRHRQRHDEGDLPWPRTDRGDQQITDADSETNAHDQLDDSTQPLTERDAEAHDGSHRREERSTVVDEMHGDQPGEPRRERRLHDRHGGVSPPRQPTREFLAKA